MPLILRMRFWLGWRERVLDVELELEAEEGVVRLHDVVEHVFLVSAGLELLVVGLEVDVLDVGELDV